MVALNNTISMQETLDEKAPQLARSGMDNKAVKTYLQLIASNSTEKNRQISRNRAIQTLLESTFEISDPSGSQKIPSQRLYQALWRSANKMKPLDFMIQGTSRPMYVEQIVTAGISTAMDRGGYDSTLRDKNGVFFNLLLYGDGFCQIGANTNKKSLAPILFTPVSGDNVYMDNFATGIRNRGTAGSAYRVVLIFSYSWNQAIDLFPKLKKIGGIGKIPRDQNAWLKTQTRTFEQQVGLEDEVEIAFAYDSAKKNFTIFAGQACTVLEEYNKDEYPFIKEGEAYIPALQFICIPSSEGAYNYGIGHLLYKLAIVSSRLLNMELGHAEDNTYPITLVNTPQGEAANFFGKLVEANKMRAAGKKPFVAMEYDPNNPNSSNVQAQSLLTQNLTTEWQLIYNTLVDEIQMMGINLKELTMEGNPTATEILSDEENSNSWIKQIMEYNASETQFAVELTMDMLTEFVSKNSKVPINIPGKVNVSGEEIRPDGITMGMLSQELKENNYYVKVNSRSGAIPSNIMLQTKISRMLGLAQPGSEAQKKLLSMFAQVNDMDIQGEEFLPQQMAVPQGAPRQGAIPEAGFEPTATDRMTFNPRTSEQAVAI